ncbi:MAG: glycoside hydrolase family 25 protein [Lachnospiraceae bacterium]|nr:glycoside hydrolase family 25 protein [Lachnospiraceae bacterium]
MNNSLKDMNNGGLGNIPRPTEDRLDKRKKKPSTLKYVLTMIAYLGIAVFVMFLGTALYVWVDEKISESATEAALSTNIAEQLNVTAIYSQDQVDEMIEEALRSSEMSGDGITEKELEEKVSQAEADKENEILGGIKTSLLDGNTMVETLRPYYPDDIVVVSNGEFHFVPINDELEKNTYEQEKLQVLESGEYQYVEDGNVVSHKGIDVSSHQGSIDWQKVADDGVEFAFIRTALRGYGTGKLVEDEYCEDNVKGAADAGIHVGLYIFSQAVNEEELLEEANLIIDKAKECGVDGPLVIDVEKVTSSSARMNALSVEERTQLVLLFCQTVENAGYKPMIYHNTEMGALMIDVAELEAYDKWYASYAETMFYPYQYDIWQYSSKGTVDGISTDVDLNISFTEFWNE